MLPQSHHNSPEVKVHERGEADDVVGDALDRVVVEQQPFHAAIPRALARHLQQLVAGQIWRKREKLGRDIINNN